MLAEAICADGCEELFWFVVVSAIVIFTVWIWTSAMAGGAAMLAVRRRRPGLGAWGLVAVMTGVTAATAIGTAVLATSLDVGPALIAVPLGALAWFVVELRHASSARGRTPAVTGGASGQSALGQRSSSRACRRGSPAGT